MSIKRRKFLSLLGGATAGYTTHAIGHVLNSNRNVYGGKIVDDVVEYTMHAVESERNIVDDFKSPVVEYHVVGQSKAMPFPIIRVRPNQTIRIHVVNKMRKTTTVHWHGIRLKNEMDGVPYMTQLPIMAGETFTYEFECPDSGTFWFHSHQNALEQMSRGQVGVLIVDDFDMIAPEIKQFSRDMVWVCKDYYIDNAGKLDICTSIAQAATTGTFGKQKRINGKRVETVSAPAGSWVRVRLLNCDNTRLMRIHAYDEQDNKVPTYVIAVDGNALKQYEPLNRNHLTPGQRLDIAVRVPKTGHVAIKNVFQRVPYPLGIVKSNGESATETQLLSLSLNPIANPDFTRAKRLKFVFLSAGGSMGKLWSINGKSMLEHSDMADHDVMGTPFSCEKKKDMDMSSMMNGKDMAEPLAQLKLGETYIFRIQNGTPHTHPIHLHGHTFTVFKSNKKKNLKPYHTDTVPLLPDEVVEFAFVADNVGDWMFHCHIIEHAATGMMGYVRVT